LQKSPFGIVKVQYDSDLTETEKEKSFLILTVVSKERKKQSCFINSNGRHSLDGWNCG